MSAARVIVDDVEVDVMTDQDDRPLLGLFEPSLVWLDGSVWVYSKQVSRGRGGKKLTEPNVSPLARPAALMEISKVGTTAKSCHPTTHTTMLRHVATGGPGPSTLLLRRLRLERGVPTPSSGPASAPAGTVASSAGLHTSATTSDWHYKRGNKKGQLKPIIRPPLPTKPMPPPLSNDQLLAQRQEELRKARLSADAEADAETADTDADAAGEAEAEGKAQAGTKVPKGSKGTKPPRVTKAPKVPPNASKVAKLSKADKVAEGPEVDTAPKVTKATKEPKVTKVTTPPNVSKAGTAPKLAKVSACPQAEA